MNLESHYPAIRRISKEVAGKTNSLYGFDITTGDDLAGDVAEKLLSDSVDLGTMDSPNGYIAETARQAALHIVDEVLRPTRDARGVRKGRIDFSDTSDPGFEYIAPSELGDAPNIFQFEETVAECAQVVESIVCKVLDTDQRAAIRAFYLEGKPGTTGTERKRRHVATKRYHTCLKLSADAT